MLHFLEAKLPLCKTFELVNDDYQKTPYPLTKAFTSHAEDVTTLEQFHERLTYHAQLGNSLIKGELTRELTMESRAGATDPMKKTWWLCLDLDYVKDELEADSVVAQLGLQKVSHIKQYSAGHGITKEFAAHYFFILKEPVLPAMLKNWLTEQNFEISQLANRFSLTRTNTSLRWPMDISVADNSRIIYIAAPRCVGFEDPIEERIVLVEKKHERANIAAQINDVDTEVVEEAKHKKIKELRKAKGLSAKQFKTKTFAGTEVLSSPGKTTVTGYKEARGFMYLNLGGGDSWGYYHPLDNPEILYNFKGEPNYLIKELLPEYYQNYKKALQQEVGNEETKYFAFLDRRTDRYFRGTFEPERNAIELFPTNSVKKVEDFYKQHSLPTPEYIEEWDYLFRFDDERVYVPEERFVNSFSETKYLREAKQSPPPSKFPSTIGKVIQSVTGGDKKTVMHFMNWLSVLIQKRQRTQTAWIFNGVPGTGKGVLVHYILKPLLGEQCVQVKSLAELEEQYNAYMENCVLLMVDESKRTQIKNLEKVMAKLKQAITDPVVPIRRMQTDHYLAKNYMNVVVTSNYPDPLSLERTDRRFNVGDYQSKPLKLDKADIARIKEELSDFAAILYAWKANEEQAKTPLQNQARQQLMYLTQNSFEVTFGAMLGGDLQFFIDDLPTDETVSIDPMATMRKDAYIGILREAQAAADAGEPHKLTRDQAWTLAEYTLGEVAKTPNKFSSLAKHYGIQFSRQRKNGVMAQIVEISWQKPEYRVEDSFKPTLRAVK